MTNHLKRIENFKITNIRSICIVLVVLAHLIIIYNGSWDIYKSNRTSSLFMILCNFIYIFHMPLFFSVSGFLAHNSYKKTSSTLSFIKKKAIRLMIPFLIIGFLYMIPIRYLVKYPPFQAISPFKIVLNFLLGIDAGHLWFLPSLFIIFILHYILVKQCSSQRLLTIIVVFLSIVGYFAPTYIGSALTNLIWFHLGYLINYQHLEKKKGGDYLLMLCIIASLGVAFYALGYNCILLRYVAKYIASVAIILLIYSIIPNKKNKIMQFFALYSFGIYLFHSPLIYISFSFLPNIHPMLMLFINFVLFGSVAILLTKIIKKVGLKRVIGE